MVPAALKEAVCLLYSTLLHETSSCWVDAYRTLSNNADSTGHCSAQQLDSLDRVPIRSGIMGSQGPRRTRHKRTRSPWLQLHLAIGLAMYLGVPEAASRAA